MPSFDPANYEGQDRLAHIEKYLSGMSPVLDASTGLVSPTLGGLNITATTFSDDFERSGTFLGSDSPSGYTWANTTGAGTLSITSGRLTVNTAGNAYGQMGFDSIPTEIGGLVSWVTGGGTDSVAASATLISSGTDYLITDAVHFTCNQTGWSFQVVVASSFTTLASGSYTLALDGAAHAMSMAINGNTATYVTPDGVTHTTTDSRIGTKSGKYVIYELGNPANAPFVRWDSVYGKESVPVGALLATLVGGGALASRRYRSTLRFYKMLFDRGAENGFTDTLTNLYVSANNNLKTDSLFNAALGFSGLNLTVSQNVKSAKSAITYSASMTPNYSLGEYQTINASNGSAFTINAPTNPPSSSQTADLAIEVQNTSGGALGGITFDAICQLTSQRLVTSSEHTRSSTAYATRRSKHYGNTGTVTSGAWPTRSRVTRSRVSSVT
jgi:hypothetical protein